MSLKAAWLALSAAFSPTLLGQPTILHGPVVDAVTYTSARVTWITDVPASTQIRYGASEAYDRTTTGLDKQTIHSWFISGLGAGATYHFQVCSESSPSSQACSQDQTVTTLERHTSAPLPPQPPRERVDTAMPSGGVDGTFEVQSDCSNLTAIIGELATLTGSGNYEVSIPAGAKCYGQFVFPVRANHSGWVIVRATEANSLPEEVRVAPQARPHLATFITDALPATYGSLQGIGTACVNDALFLSHNAPGMPLFVCIGGKGVGPERPVNDIAWSGAGPVIVTAPGHNYKSGDIVRLAGTGYSWLDGYMWSITVLDEERFQLEASRAGGPKISRSEANVARNEAWRQVPFASGSEIPQSCSPGDWFYNTTASQKTEAAHWCTSQNVWTRVRFINTGFFSNFSAIRFAPNAEKYRFIGIEVTHTPAPDPPPSGWSLRENYRQGNVGSLITLAESNRHIVFDRCDIHGLDYPSRLFMGIHFDGSHVALINSRVHKVNRWTTASDWGHNESIAINVPLGPGPGKIANNYLEAIGITVFFPDDAGYHKTPAADYEIVRNHFAHPEQYLLGSPLNPTRKNYQTRHAFELKRGRRMLIEGNIFDSNWADVNQGALIALSPRAAISAAKVITRIEDRLMTVAASTQPFEPGTLVYVSATSNPDLNGIWEIESAPAPNQFTLRNAPYGASSTGRVIAVASDIQLADIDLKSNILRYAPNGIWLTGHDNALPVNTKTTQRIRFINNVVYGMDTARASKSSIFQKDRPGVLIFVSLGMEDLIIRNNTFADIRGSSPTLLFHDNIRQGANAGLDVRDNIFISELVVMSQTSGVLFGQQSLDMQWTAHPQGQWTFTNNVFCCTTPAFLSRRNQVNSPNIWLQPDTNPGFQNASRGDLRLLPSSPLKGIGTCLADLARCLTSTTDPGADMDELERQLSPSDVSPR